jgi:MoxR-like ATPase
LVQSYTRDTVEKLYSIVNDNYVFGQENVVKKLILAFLARGHVLIEGPPGTAKTFSSKVLARILAKDFRRIQFTSDLLPSDISGSFLYSSEKNAFHFLKGPIFSDFIVADEINRAPPRTQSALLEAMEERQVTVEGQSFVLSSDFFVIATQNPSDFEGTFPLPEVQLDRFMMKFTAVRFGA